MFHTTNGRWGLLATIALSLFLHYPPAPLAGVAHIILDQGTFAAYWIILGVLSSVGLGATSRGFWHRMFFFLVSHPSVSVPPALPHQHADYAASPCGIFAWDDHVVVLWRAWVPGCAVHCVRVTFALPSVTSSPA